jgi:clan AA aspartic protease
MGIVMVKIKLTNYVDLVNAESGLISPDQVRVVEIDAMADTGAIRLALPEDVVERLGLRREGSEGVRLADGRRLRLPLAQGIRIELLGRRAECDALVLPAGTTALLGAVPLELLDLVVVPSTLEVITNPAHPDGPVFPL